MLNFFKLNNSKLGVRFSGINYKELLSAIQLNGGFTFHKEYANLRSVWVGDKRYGGSLIQLLSIIDGNLPSRSIIDYCNRIELETKFIERVYNPDLFKGMPTGEYQITGIKNCISQSRYMLAWQMRLGKGVCAIVVLNHLIQYNLVDSILYVAPPESIYNFRRELLKWNTFGLTSEDIYIADTKNRDPFNSGKKVILMSYRTFLMLSDEVYNKTHRQKSTKYRKPPLPINNWGRSRVIILDESQRIARMKARQTKVLHLHKHYFDYRYLLSGTPEPNKKIEGWFSQISFLDPNALPPSFYGWLATLAKVGNRFSRYAVQEYYPDKIEEFVDYMKKWVSREYVKDNLDLPELVPVRNYAVMPDKQKEIYKAVAKGVLSDIKNRDGRIDSGKLRTVLPHVMSALDNPYILKDNLKITDPSLLSLIKKWKFKDHPKLGMLSSLLDTYINEEKRKVVVWSGHPKTIDSLGKYYKKYKPLWLHGQTEIPAGMTKEAYRDQIVEKFKKDPECTLLIASYYVLHTSISLIEATRSIYFDRSWNSEYFLQSKERTQGPLQKENVVMNLLILEDSMDERLDKNLEGKENLNDYLFKKEHLTKEQWERLFLSSSDLE